MRLRSREGIVRRPIEYALIGVIILLIGILLWSIWEIRKDNQAEQTADVQEAVVLQGTLDEVDELTEADAAAEASLDKRFDMDELEAASADSAADNIGGTYDETTY